MSEAEMDAKVEVEYARFVADGCPPEEARYYAVEAVFG